MRHILLSIAIFLTVLVTGCFASEVLQSGPSILSLIPSIVTTPESLSSWEIEKFTYQNECDFCDHWKTPKETLRDRGGDCEDFAILNKAILKEFHIPSQILFMELKKGDKTTGHMILFYTRGDRGISVFDNMYLLNTDLTTIREVLEKYYPEWTRAAFADGIWHYYSEWFV